MRKGKGGQDKIEQIFFVVYRSTVSFNNRLLKSLKNVDSQAKLPPDEQIMAELEFLHIYAIYQTIFRRLKSQYEVCMENFQVEYRKKLRNDMPEEMALKHEMKLLNAITGYMDKHNKTLAKGANYENQIEFGRYISYRVVGDQYGDDIRYIMILYGSYTSNLIELLRLIDTYIENIR